MELIREYLLSVSAAALICSLIRSLAGDHGLIQLLCGLCVLMSMLRPIAGFSVREISFDHWDISPNSQAAVSEGKDFAQAAMERHIKERCQAYILDKAKDYGSSINTEFFLDETLTPVSCNIYGGVSAYVREQLSEILERDLGISREAQQWIP